MGETSSGAWRIGIFAGLVLCLGSSFVWLVGYVGSAAADGPTAEQTAAESFIPASTPLEVRNFFEPHSHGPDATSYDQLTEEDKRKTDEMLTHILETHTSEAHQDLAGASRFGRWYVAQKRAERKAGLSGIGETAVP
jgi:hypothetical protein